MGCEGRGVVTSGQAGMASLHGQQGPRACGDGMWDEVGMSGWQAVLGAGCVGARLCSAVQPSQVPWHSKTWAPPIAEQPVPLQLALLHTSSSLHTVAAALQTGTHLSHTGAAATSLLTHIAAPAPHAVHMHTAHQALPPPQPHTWYSLSPCLVTPSPNHC